MRGIDARLLPRVLVVTCVCAVPLCRMPDPRPPRARRGHGRPDPSLAKRQSNEMTRLVKQILKPIFQDAPSPDASIYNAPSRPPPPAIPPAAASRCD